MGGEIGEGEDPSATPSLLLCLFSADYEAVVKLSEDFNGADLRNVCTEAGVLCMYVCMYVCVCACVCMCVRALPPNTA